MTSTPMQPTKPIWLNDLAEKDRFGDRVHYAIALTLLAILPCNSAIAGAFFGALVIWYLVRLYYWKPYMLSGPMRVLVPGVLWIAYLALNLAWSPDTTLGFRGVWANRWILVVPALWPLMVRWRYLLLAILIGALIQAFAQIIQGISEWSTINYRSITGLNDHPSTAAAWIAAATVGVIGLYLSGILRRWYWLLTLIPLIMSLILSSSRGGILAAILGSMVITGCLLFTRTLKVRRLGVLALPVLILLGGIFSVRNQVLPTIQKTYTATSAAIESGKLLDLRLVWWKSSVRQWKNHPILGYGIGGTRDAMETDEQLRLDGQGLTKKHQEYLTVINQPHSTYVQVLLEGGIIGIGLLTFLLGSIAIMAIRTARNHPIGSIALGALIVWMVTAAFDSWHTQGQTLALLWVAAIFASTHPACFRSTTSQS